MLTKEPPSQDVKLVWAVQLQDSGVKTLDTEENNFSLDMDDDDHKKQHITADSSILTNGKLEQGDGHASSELNKSEFMISKDSSPDLVIKVYRRRFLMLFLFSMCSMLNAIPWIQYAIIADITSCYFGVDLDTVNWTSLVYMVVFIPFVFPVMWIMDKKGIKFTLLLGAFFNCLGGGVQCGSLAPDRFPVALSSQTIYAVAQVCILSLPPYVAGVWFGAEEVALACAFGVFGNQLGNAIGFILPPIIISPECENKDGITQGLGLIAYVMAALNIVLLIAVTIMFKEKPTKPPSIAQAKKTENEGMYFQSIKNLFTNVPFDLLLLAYGIITGTYFAISTILNEMVLIHFPGEEIAAGWMGALLVFAGMAGSVASGYIVDKTHKFKEITVAMFVISCITMVAYTGLIRMQILWLQFLLIFILGFFMTGYLPVGFDFGAEITYPESEAISASLLNTSTQIFSIAITIAASALLETYGDLASNIFLCVCLLAGCITTACIKCELRRCKLSAIQVSEPDDKDV